MNSIRISYYHTGNNSQPYARIPISDLNMVLTGGYFVTRTEQLKQIKDEKYRRQYQIENFPQTIYQVERKELPWEIFKK